MLFWWFHDGRCGFIGSVMVDQSELVEITNNQLLMASHVSYTNTKQNNLGDNNNKQRCSPCKAVWEEWQQKLCQQTVRMLLAINTRWQHLTMVTLIAILSSSHAITWACRSARRLTNSGWSSRHHVRIKLYQLRSSEHAVIFEMPVNDFELTGCKNEYKMEES